MRSTVGPHPPAVYWRRRAVVAGVLILAIIVLFVSCSGSDTDEPRGKNASGPQSPGAATPATSKAASPEPDVSFDDGGSEGQPARPKPEDVTSPPATASPAVPDPNATAVPDPNATGQDTSVVIPADGSCADGEIVVSPVPSATTVRRGAPVTIQLMIKNVSNRTCKRDVGAEAQELYIDQGAQKAWSSDTCSPDRSTDVRELAPGAERLISSVTWNGKSATKCAGGLAAGPAPAAGQYELRGRVGSRSSKAVQIALTTEGS